MIDYDVMVFVRCDNPTNLLDCTLWSDDNSGVGIIPKSLYMKFRELLIGKSLNDVSEIQLIKLRAGNKKPGIKPGFY